MPTGIPYVDEAVNAVVGCTPIAAGCQHCWSKELHDMRHDAYKKGRDVPEQYAKPFGEIQLLPGRIDKVLSWRKPRTAFWCSSSDMFHKNVPDYYIFQMIRAMTFASWHTHLILTKRVERAARVLTRERLVMETGRQELDESIRFGISCSTQKDLDEMSKYLFQIPAAHYWLSAEPLLEDLDLVHSPQGTSYKPQNWGNETTIIQPCLNTLKHFSWVVVGAESGPHRRPCNIEHVRSIVRQCKAAEVKVYVKQVSLPGCRKCRFDPCTGLHGHKPIDILTTDPSEFPADLRVQEIAK